MTGNFDTQDKGSDTKTTETVRSVILATTTLKADGPEVVPDNKGDDASDSITDTVAAVVSAVLALVFIMVLVCLIRVIRKRRRERQGQRLNQPVVQTIAPGAFGSNLSAYRHAQITTSPVPISGSLSWESVSTSQVPVPRSQDLEDSLSPTIPREATPSSPCISLSASALIHAPPSESASLPSPPSSESTSGLSSTAQPTSSSSSPCRHSLAVSSSKTAAEKKKAGAAAAAAIDSGYDDSQIDNGRPTSVICSTDNDDIIHQITDTSPPS